MGDGSKCRLGDRLAGALISITLNPLLFATIEPAQRWLRTHSDRARAAERSADPLAELPATVDASTLTGHVVLVGYGRVGRRIGERLEEKGITYVVAEQNRELVERLRERSTPAVSGDAMEPAVLIQAHVARAKILVIATPDAAVVRRMVETARALNPDIEIFIRSHSDEETALLRRAGLGEVFMGEHELATAMAARVLQVLGGREEKAGAA